MIINQTAGLMTFQKYLTLFGASLEPQSIYSPFFIEDYYIINIILET